MTAELLKKTEPTELSPSPYDYVIRGKKVPPEVERAAEERLKLLKYSNTQTHQEPVDDYDPTFFPPISRPMWYK